MKNTVALIVLIGIVCLTIGYSLGKGRGTEEVPAKITEEKRQDNLYQFETSKGRYDVLVLRDEIWFNEFSNIINELGHFKITREQYPELFRQGVANSSFISVQLVEKKKSEIKIEVTNNQPDHGSFAATYRLSFDPITKEIVIDKNGDY